MPMLANLIAGLLGGLASMLTAWFGVSAAVKVAAVAAFVGFAVALVAAFNVVVSPLAAQLFATSWGQVLGLAFPPVAGTCLAAIAATWSACGLYGLQKRVTAIVTG